MAYDWTQHQRLEVFTTPYEQYRERQGERFEIIREVDRTTFDFAECGSIFVIRFPDGTEIEALPEEIFAHA